MKTTIEVNGYEIVIEETDGFVSVSALKDDEVIEEFQLESTSGSESEDEMGEVGEMTDGDEDELLAFGQDEEEDDDFSTYCWLKRWRRLLLLLKIGCDIL
jgi:hypothetical protein